jgi:DinB superfamily
MKTDANLLIEELQAITESACNSVRSFKQYSNKQLNFKTGISDWSALECIEHLNLYGDYYLPEITRRIGEQRLAPSSDVFKSGLIGNYLAGLMKAENGKIKKLKSPKDKSPDGSLLTMAAADRFLEQQELLKSLLVQARGIDLTRTKVAISLTRFIKLRLGDTLRFVVYHIERHIRQAERMLKQAKDS